VDHNQQTAENIIRLVAEAVGLRLFREPFILDIEAKELKVRSLELTEDEQAAVEIACRLFLDLRDERRRQGQLSIDPPNIKFFRPSGAPVLEYERG